MLLADLFFKRLRPHPISQWAADLWMQIIKQTH
jgi:hypothetical protein